MSRTVTRIAIGVAALLLLVAFLWLQSCDAKRTADTRADLAEGQAGAAIESGADAVETIGNAQANEATIADTVKEGTDAIRNAPAGDSNDAADRAACRLRAYRNQPRCVTLLGPVAQ